MALTKRLTATKKVRDSEGKVTGYEGEYHVIPDEEHAAAGYGPRVLWLPMTPEEYARTEDDSSAALTAANNALNKQIADERKAAADKEAALTAAKDAAIEAKDAQIAERDALINEALALP